MRKLFVIMGKASSGKDTLVKMLQEQLEISMALSFTTRPLRNGEKQGVEYNFITEKEFIKQIKSGEIVEYTFYNVSSGDTWYYGLDKTELEKADYVIVIANPDGLEQLKEYYGDKVVSIAIDTDADIRIKRYLNRESMNEEKVAECCRRFLEDNKDFKDIAPDYRVINNDTYLKDAYLSLEGIIRRQIAKDLLVRANEGFYRDAVRSVCPSK